MYSPDTTKYLIQISLTAEGVVEKPDVVGAIFGQTEGLLGEDLDLRDLQRTGRVGRIDVQVTSKKGETKGEILISTSLDRAETAILAASLETIDRVGPCIAHVTVDSIEDIRLVKRKKIVERAKEILLDRFEDGAIDSDELLEDVRQSIACWLAWRATSARLTARQQAKMRLKHKPVQPTWNPRYAPHDLRIESWSKFLSEAYWNVALEK